VTPLFGVRDDAPPELWIEALTAAAAAPPEISPQGLCFCRRARENAGIGGRRVVGLRPGVRERIAGTAKE